MEDKEFDYMNVIPLVDVMMVLLTIVLMTSTFIATGVIPVELPKAAEKKSDLPKALTLSIDKGGNIYFESERVTLLLLRQRLAPLTRESPIIIRADKDSTVQMCVDVLELLSSMGFQKVALQTEKRGS
ncbi:MAG: biopolymer transporter ExbD [Desulfobacterota bacterium]|nr:biopolymer transporter ExbD [Thermodesulfobacteriota bacterium]MDW8002525.1 biopolymer transporter ExbD [Deltaproteobacteria bacterium]